MDTVLYFFTKYWGEKKEDYPGNIMNIVSFYCFFFFKQGFMQPSLDLSSLYSWGWFWTLALYIFLSTEFSGTKCPAVHPPPPLNILWNHFMINTIFLGLWQRFVNPGLPCWWSHAIWGTLAVMYMRLFRTREVASGEPQPFPFSPWEAVTSPSRSLTSSSGLLGLDPGRRSLLSTSSMLCSHGNR